jgi:hypothetical protein
MIDSDLARSFRGMAVEDEYGQNIASGQPVGGGRSPVQRSPRHSGQQSYPPTGFPQPDYSSYQQGAPSPIREQYAEYAFPYEYRGTTDPAVYSASPNPGAVFPSVTHRRQLMRVHGC